ncbi:MAG TPA: class I SAM-dependent methyltransferase [Jatrophihabitans sp.]|nr:class I SAM-dependent methyltransferase [Jatrophihabitans sp.]
MTRVADQATNEYALGHAAQELARLDHQAEILAQPTRAILTMAGLTPGMRVLDLGTGTGEVALLAAELVGPAGDVLGVDQSGAALDYAERKCAARGVHNVRFGATDLSAGLPAGPFDAVIGRLVLPYLPDPVDTVRAALSRLRAGGLYVAMEYDMNAVRSQPTVPLVQRMSTLISATFDAVGQSQTLGPHLAAVFRAAGAQSPAVVGIQAYLDDEDPRGPAMITGVIRSLLPAIERHGLGVASEIDVDTLEARLAAETAIHQAVICPPTLVGAWSRRN